MANSIKSIKAREILDSRGNPTVEVEISCSAGIARAMVPSGASTGTHEALELRDGDKRFNGKGVLKAVSNVNNIIAPKIKGMDCTKQHDLDNFLIKLDGTPNKSNLGANAILGVSMAACRAGAMMQKKQLYEWVSEIFSEMQEKARSKSGKRKKAEKIIKAQKYDLPVPAFNIINGGGHAGNQLSVQEFMILPVGAKNFREALRYGAETYHSLKALLQKKYGRNAINVGDEGGFAPPMNSTEEALAIISEAIKNVGYAAEIKIGMDCAASEFYDSKKDVYVIDNRKYSRDELLDFYSGLVKKYPIISIEDPFAEDDFAGFAMITKKLGSGSQCSGSQCSGSQCSGSQCSGSQCSGSSNTLNACSKIQIVGDDHLVTNVSRIKRAVKEKSCNALLLKVNQIGTVTEAMAAADLAISNSWNVMVSHRSGETEDSFIADLVVGIGNGQIKSGAPCRSERLAKYNQLVRIEEELEEKGSYYKFV